MLHIHRYKIILLSTLLLLANAVCTAQRTFNLPEFEDRKAYYGLTFGYNKSSFKSSMHPQFLETDSVYSAQPLFASGFNFGFIATLKLTRRFELRYNPQLVFAEKNILYHLKYPQSINDETEYMTKKIESIIVSNPIQLKLNSDRINNFSFYVFGGIKLDVDVASNARKKRAEQLVKIDYLDTGIEAGLGLQFYFKYFIFTPEVKISNGRNNIHFREAPLKFSNVIDQLRSRMIVFSLHLQG